MHTRKLLYFDDRFPGGRPRRPNDRTAAPAARSRDVRRGGGSVSYTHLTLPTKA